MPKCHEERETALSGSSQQDWKLSSEAFQKHQRSLTVEASQSPLSTSQVRWISATSQYIGSNRWEDYEMADTLNLLPTELFVLCVKVFAQTPNSCFNNHQAHVHPTDMDDLCRQNLAHSNIKQLKNSVRSNFPVIGPQPEQTISQFLQHPDLLGTPKPWSQKFMLDRIYHQDCIEKKHFIGDPFFQTETALVVSSEGTVTVAPPP
jgi:hypothetical protein